MRFHAASRSSLVEPDDSVCHIVEGDAEHGLPLADLAEQPRILDRDDRLVGKSAHQFDLPFGERLDPWRASKMTPIGSASRIRGTPSRVRVLLIAVTAATLAA